MKAPVVFCFLFLNALVGLAQPNRKADQRRSAWPDAAQLQYAGNIGMASAGLGYTIRNDRFRALLVYGFVPGQYAAGKTVHLISAKATARVAQWHITESMALVPYAGLAGTLEPGRHSLLTLPDHYPDDYYGTTSFHATLLGGTRLGIQKDDSGFPKTIEPFVEIGATETLLYYKLLNREVNAGRAFSMALGVSFKL